MTLSLTLDVAISIIFVFVLAALLASTVNEMISGILKLRGVYLTKAIESLTSLDTANVFRWGGVAGWFFAHFRQSTPTVTAAVDQAALAITDAAKTAAAAAGASAASVQTAFTTALAAYPALASRFAPMRQSVASAAASATATADSVLAVIQPIGGVANLQNHPLLVGTPSSLPSYVPARDFAAALLSVLHDGSAATPIVQVKTTIQALPDGDLKTQLLAFVAAGADDLDKLRTRIENWFDDTMERLSGIYARSSQYVMLVLGLLIAVGMNVNAIELAKIFWDQPAMSKAISDSAAHFVSQQGGNLFGCVSGSPQPAGATGDAGKSGTAAPACATLADIQTVLDQQQLPIGRSADVNFFGCPYLGKTAADHAARHWKLTKSCAGGNWKLWTVAGWVVTAFAVSLGAQFWFGLLSQLMNLRAAGDKPDRANATS